jgi:tRNA uridine 5-carbamoylmethylation protein Kti12
VYDDESFHSIRSEGLKILEEHIVAFKTNECSDTTSQLQQVAIVDDIMHLRSMRRAVFKVARKYSVPLLVVWVKTDLTAALERNGRRRLNEGDRIPSEVIQKLFEQFDEPSSKHICDRHCCTIDGNSTDR